MCFDSCGMLELVLSYSRCKVLTSRFPQDPVNGAQKAGSWAVRETFVAVVTSNIPMIFPLLSHWLRPLLGSLRSLSSHAAKSSGLSRSADSGPRAFRLEDKNPRRGMGPRSVNPITNISFDGSEERIFSEQNDDLPDRDGQAIASDMERERGCEAGLGSASGGIMKETCLRITETRKTSADLILDETAVSVGDYYLVEQSRKTADGSKGGEQGSRHKKDRSSLHYGMGR